MNQYDIEVLITPREGLLDPEGHAVQNALRSLEFDDVSDVQVGRVVRLRVAAETPDAAHDRVDEMCRQLLANPVTEDYQIEMENVS
ncbi:MAG: phosphoribosylformylglycinamidine synthase subunit PurS [Gemmatimonadota bacterium]